MASEPRGSAIVPPPELRRQMLPPRSPSAASDETFSYVPHVAIAVSAVTEASTAQEKPMLDGKSDRPPAAGSASPLPAESSPSTAPSLLDRSGSTAPVSLGASAPRT